MLADIMRNMEPKFPGLLDDGIQVLIYAGEYDFICNWLGGCSQFVRLPCFLF
jgi:serine carboxypeptidase-like clade 4